MPAPTFSEIDDAAEIGARVISDKIMRIFEDKEIIVKQKAIMHVINTYYEKGLSSVEFKDERQRLKGLKYSLLKRFTGKEERWQQKQR